MQMFVTGYARVTVFFPTLNKPGLVWSLQIYFSKNVYSGNVKAQFLFGIQEDLPACLVPALNIWTENQEKENTAEFQVG